MGLKQDLIDAKLEALKASGANVVQTKQLELQCELERDAIVSFLTKVEFRVTQLKCPVVVEDFKTDDQEVNIEPQTLLGDKAPIIDAIQKVPVVGQTLANGDKSKGIPGLLDLFKRAVKPLLKGGSTLPGLNLNKSDGTIVSNGYAFIGDDPITKNSFNTDDENGQKSHTTVQLFEDDIDKDLL